MLMDLEIMDFGFTKEEIEEIRNNFECTPNILDWEQMILFKSDEEIFRYFFIDEQDKETIIETLLEMGRVSTDDLDDHQTVMGSMLDDCDESVFKLPNGRWVVFSDELLAKEAKQQMY
ncbi:hypothetical protein OCB08_21800 [Bacillus cereus]|uniref:hypothetical protein n=1 Tax=Bacillus TaxID=1386 RepID=UPI001D0EBF7F|nr:hypothetical protein [Bacillus cereus]MCC2370111.1 hypothetical protein [Bacillus cereus]MCC2490935.1 hypothetical protein [Bacillus cereus]MCU5627994.1 hypothetical protein [Bacillus cereus]MDF9552951.1 hypothetical protein [Bacillus cereus]MDF9604175.1 hypothetical protein [Bacillus cereus]